MADMVTTELQRRLIKEGFSVEHGDSFTAYRCGGEEIVVAKEGFVMLMTAWSSGKVNAIRKEVTAYMTTFQNAARIPCSDNDRDARILLSYDNCDLVGIRLLDGTMEFELHNTDEDNPFKTKYKTYAHAKFDFLFKTRLIDHNLLFSRKRLEILQSSLTALLSIDEGKHVSADTAEEIEKVLLQISGILAVPVAEIELMFKND